MTILASPIAFKREDLLQMFNLKLENILEISVAHKPEAVYIYIKLTKKLHTCPVCESQTDKVKAYSEKKILHSLLTNYPCFIIYKARRYVCPTCKKTFYEHNPFSHQNMRSQ